VLSAASVALSQTVDNLVGKKMLASRLRAFIILSGAFVFGKAINNYKIQQVTKFLSREALIHAANLNICWRCWVVGNFFARGETG
jgi:hypothetical protein